MKKILTITAIIATLLPVITSCKKDKKTENTKPQIEIEASTIEIIPEMKGEVNITTPEGLDILKLEVTVPVTHVAVINQYVELTANRATLKNPTAILEVTADPTTSSKLLAAKVIKLDGKNLVGRTNIPLDLGKLILAIADDSTENNSNFRVNVKVTDREGQSVSRPVTFHWTSAPEMEHPTDPVSMSADKPECKINIKAMGRIAALTLTPAGDDGIIKYVKARTYDKTGVIDLCNDAKAETFFGLPAINKILDKESVTLDLASLLTQFSVEAEKDASQLEILVRDTNGKEAKGLIKLKKN